MPKNNPFASGRGQCIFCTRQPPEASITKEHVFADWLRALFPRSPQTTHTLGVHEWASSPGRSPAKVTRRQAQGHSGTKKIRKVCRTCNGTWLSQIEEAAKPILIPLIGGERLEVDSAMQQALATWAAKTAMTAEQLHPSKVVVLQDERTWLKDHRIPPPGWNVWIGTYYGLPWSELAIQQQAAKLRVPVVDHGKLSEHNLMFTILGMRRLMFVVVSSSWSRMDDIINAAGSPNGRSLAPIWPITQESVSWPLPFAVSDADADQMAAAYFSDIAWRS